MLGKTTPDIHIETLDKLKEDETIPTSQRSQDTKTQRETNWTSSPLAELADILTSPRSAADQGETWHHMRAAICTS